MTHDSDATANSVAEGAGNGSTLGITAFAAEPNGAASTYSLIADTSLGGFTINAVTGVVTIADATKIDFETAAGHSYGITVQATNGAQTTSQAFTIAVADVAPSTPVDSNAGANTAWLPNTSRFVQERRPFSVQQGRGSRRWSEARLSRNSTAIPGTPQAHASKSREERGLRAP